MEVTNNTLQVLEDIMDVNALYNAGYSFPEIATMLNLTEARVRVYKIFINRIRETK